MKKLIYLLPLILLGCNSDLDDIDTYINIDMDIFEFESTVVGDGDELIINFDNSGRYTLSIIDEFTNVTYTNEKLNVNQGSVNLNIYTKSLPKGSYKFIIKDNQDNIIKQTKIKL